MATMQSTETDASPQRRSMGRPVGARTRFAPTFMRAWRKHRGMTLRCLADAINQGEQQPVTSYASLARIEQGLQPYSQPILEGAARALATTPAAILAAGPVETDEITSLWSAMDAERRARAVAILRALNEAP